jgi:hypothetical protein
VECTETLSNKPVEMSEFRKGVDMWEETETVRCSHLLYQDFQHERNDIPKFHFYIFLLKHYRHLKGKSQAGNSGYRLKYKPIK